MTKKNPEAERYALAEKRLRRYTNQLRYNRKAEIVQTKNPITERYVKIDRSTGWIIGHKKSPGPYKNIPIARRRRKRRSPTKVEEGQVRRNRKAEIVQIKNPKTERYVMIDRATGRIIKYKKTKGPYKNIPIARKRRRKEDQGSDT